MPKTNPIKLFLILIICSFSLGFSVKKFLKSNYLNNYISKKLLVISSKHTKFKYNNFNIFVSKKHFLPTLILQVNEVSFFIPDKCRTQINILAKKIISPVNIISALWYRKNIKLNLLLENVYVERKLYTCENEVTISSNDNDDLGSSSPVDMKQYILKGVKNLPKLKILTHKLAKRLQDVSIDHLEYSDRISSQEVSKLNMNFTNLKLYFRSGEMNITASANWPYHKVLGENLPIPIFRFSVKEDQVKLKLLGKVKEGHLSVDARAESGKEKVSIDTRVRQVPIGEAVNFLRNVLNAKVDYQSSLSWLNCHLRITGIAKEIFNKKQTIKQCQIVGELGEWNLSPYRFSLAPLNMQSEPILLSVKKARLNKVVKFLSIESKVNEIKKMGLFTGDISWSPMPHIWRANGVIKNIEVEYNLKNRLIKQLIKKVKFSINGERTQVRATAQEFELKNGLLAGKVNYNYDKIDKFGKLEAIFDKVKFSDGLEKIILAGETEFHFAQLKGIADFKKINLSGKLKSKKIDSPYYKSGPYEVNIKAKNNSLSGNIVFSKLNFKEDIFDLSQVKLNSIISEPDLLRVSLIDANLDFSLDSESLIWKFSNVQSRAKNLPLVFTNFGTLNKIKLYSQLDFFMPKKEISWSWSGSPKDYHLSLSKSYMDGTKVNYKPGYLKSVYSKAANFKNKPPHVKRDSILDKAKKILPLQK